MIIENGNYMKWKFFMISKLFKKRIKTKINVKKVELLFYNFVHNEIAYLIKFIGEES